MPLQLTWKKIMTGALAFTLVTGSGAAALTAPIAISAATNRMSTPFTDINAGHWAEKHIAKLALQGIITGYSNSVDNTFVFKPSQSVKQQEAVLMALRFAGLLDRADMDAIIGFPDTFVVGQFYKPYIDLAFNEGLLDQNEEYAMAAADPSEEWGSRPASREWVTKLIVKAIGEEAVANQLRYEESAFDDADMIKDDYKGYVNAAVQMGLVKGITAVKFDPKANINRASLATLFSRAQNQYPIEYPGQANGVISKLTDNEIIVYSDKKEISYALTDDTLFYHYNTETPITKDQLLEYGDISIIAKDGIAQYIEVQGDVQHIASIHGTVLRYVEAEKLLYLWIDNKPVEVTYSDFIVVEDSDGKELLISDLKSDTQIRIIQDTFRETPVAFKIVASAQPQMTTMSGKLYSIDGKSVTINVNDSLISKFMAVNAVIQIEGLPGATVSDLIKDADQVELSLNGEDQVTMIKVLNRNVQTIAGARVVNFSEADKLLTIVDPVGNAQALYFTEKTKFDYMGTIVNMQAAMSLMQQNANVLISYTHNSIVAMQFVLSHTGTLVDLNTKDKTISIMTSDGTNVTLPYNTAPVEIRGKAMAGYNDLKYGDKLTLALHMTKAEVALIRVHRTIQYEVVSVDLVNKKLRLKNDTTGQFDQLVGDAELLSAEGGKQTINQIKVGSFVDASYIGTQQLVKLQTVASSASNG